MGDHSTEDIRRHVKIYITVFIALLVGTLVTVGAAYVDLDGKLFKGANITAGLFIACVKAFLVAGFFMHLISERKAIYAILGFTAFFFVGLMFLTLSAFFDFPKLSELLH